jgi:hypothetical protein
MKNIEIVNFTLKDESLWCKTNPFMKDEDGSPLTIKSVMKNKVVGKNKGHIITDTALGEVKGGQIVYNVHKVDNEQFVKIFTKSVSHLFDLTRTGNKAFGYIASVLPPNTDRVFISFKEMKEFCEWGTIQNCYKGMRELYIAKIIAPTTTYGFWFINPNVLFNGNRLLIVDEYQKWDNINLPEMGH